MYILNSNLIFEQFMFVTLPKQLKIKKMKEVAVGILTVAAGVTVGMILADLIKTKLMN